MDDQPVRLLFFGSASDALQGQREDQLQLSPQLTTAKDFTNILLRRHPSLASILPTARFAVNLCFVENDADDVFIRPGDEVAIIPPVSGG